MNYLALCFTLNTLVFADMASEEKKSDQMCSQGVFRPLALAWELGYTIAIPIVVLALGGRLLDRYFESSPVFLLVGILTSICITSFLVYRKAKSFLSNF